MSDEFNPDKFHDEYRERIQAMLDEKSKGGEITVAAPEAPQRAQIIHPAALLIYHLPEVFQ